MDILCRMKIALVGVCGFDLVPRLRLEITGIMALAQLL
jgi:hypothetical protein